MSTHTEQTTCLFIGHINYPSELREKKQLSAQPVPGAGTKKKIPSRKTIKEELERPTGEINWSFHRSQQVTELKQCLHTGNCSSSHCELKEACISGSCTIGQITQNLYLVKPKHFFFLLLQKHLWWFSYLSSYSDLCLKLGQFFLVHSARSKEQKQVQLNMKTVTKKSHSPLKEYFYNCSRFFKLLQHHPKQTHKPEL